MIRLFFHTTYIDTKFLAGSKIIGQTILSHVLNLALNYLSDVQSNSMRMNGTAKRDSSRATHILVKWSQSPKENEKYDDLMLC